MSDGDRERILRLVRRARRRLEAARVAQAAARGALVGGALGLVALLAMKIAPGLPVLPALPWALLALGAFLGLAASLLRGAIGLAAAALYLDRRLGTAERIATVATRPSGPLTDRVAGELEAVRRLPRSPVPREAALVPAVLFLLFAAGLLPAAGAREEPRAGTFVVVGVAGAEEEGAASLVEVDAPLLEKLAQGEPPSPAEAEMLREAIEQGLRRPEDRRAARAALERARLGDAEAAPAVAEALRPREEARTGPALLASAYPEAEELVRAYRRALQQEKKQ